MNPPDVSTARSPDAAFERLSLQAAMDADLHVRLSEMPLWELWSAVCADEAVRRTGTITNLAPGIARDGGSSAALDLIVTVASPDSGPADISAEIVFVASCGESGTTVERIEADEAVDVDHPGGGTRDAVAEEDDSMTAIRGALPNSAMQAAFGETDLPPVSTEGEHDRYGNGTAAVMPNFCYECGRSTAGATRFCGGCGCDLTAVVGHVASRDALAARGPIEGHGGAMVREPLAPRSTAAPGSDQNGYGFAALVLGVLAVVLAVVGVGIIASVMAILFGIVGRRRADEGRATNRGLATAGLVLGFAGATMTLLFLALLLFS